MADHPIVVFEGKFCRAVKMSGPSYVVEFPNGRDALGQTRWSVSDKLFLPEALVELAEAIDTYRTTLETVKPLMVAAEAERDRKRKR